MSAVEFSNLCHVFRIAIVHVLIHINFCDRYTEKNDEQRGRKVRGKKEISANDIARK